MVPSPIPDVSFCPRCGRALEGREAYGRVRPVCAGCGYVHFQVTANAAVAVVVHERRVLLIQRGIQPYRGHWGFPGGFQEHGEPLHETARRETFEETGLAVETDRVLFVGLTRDDPRKTVNVVVYLARPLDTAGASVASAVQARDDADDVRFFGLDELPDRIAFENNQIVLRQLERDFPDGDIR